MSFRKIILWLLKVVIAAVSIWMIVRSVSFRESADSYLELLGKRSAEPANLAILIGSFLLMITNWMIEAVKWQFLLKKIYPVSLIRSLGSVLTGVTVSFFMPNRTGEFAGKVLHLPACCRIRAAVASIVGSLNQLLITLIIGGVASLVFLHFLREENKWLYSITAGFIITGMIMLVYAYFNISRVYEWMHAFRWLRKADTYAAVLTYYTSTDLLKVTCLSLMRYLVFSAQFILLMHFFGIRFGLFDEMISVSMIFLFLSLIPTFAFSEVFTRGSVALYFLSPYAMTEGHVLATVFFLWCINLVIPSLAGALSFLKVKISGE
jgi:hypothetical protein